MKIIDPNGKWVVNAGAYVMHDPESNIRLEPGETVKVPETSWLNAQIKFGCVKLAPSEEGTSAAPSKEAVKPAPVKVFPASKPASK